METRNTKVNHLTLICITFISSSVNLVSRLGLDMSSCFPYCITAVSRVLITCKWAPISLTHFIILHTTFLWNRPAQLPWPLVASPWPRMTSEPEWPLTLSDLLGSRTSQNEDLHFLSKRNWKNPLGIDDTDKFSSLFSDNLAAIHKSMAQCLRQLCKSFKEYCSRRKSTRPDRTNFCIYWPKEGKFPGITVWRE